MKFQKKDFEERNLETIREFSKEKASNGEYIVLLQENLYFNQNSYLSLISKAHDKLVNQNSGGKAIGSLSLKLDHFFNA